MTKRVLSIDIGLIKTRICEVEYGKKNPRIYNCITFDTPDNAIEDGYIRDKESFAAVMKEKLYEAKMRITDVVFTISSTKIANREVIIPLVKDNRIQAVVDAGAQDYFPVDVSEYIISYSILERINNKEDKKLKLLLLAAPSNMVKNYYSFAQVMNFNIVALDYIGNSAFQVLKRQVGSGINLSIQINEKTTLINVIDNEVLALQRTIPYGSMAVVESVLENKVFEVNTEADAIKLLCQEELINMQFNMENEEAAATLSVASESYNRALKEIRGKEEVTESLRYLVSNVTRVLDYYNSKFPEKKVATIFITGQGAKFKGIERLFHNEIGIEIRRIDRLFSVVFQKTVPDMEQSDYMCAIGATIQPIGFISKDIIAREVKKNNQFSMSIIFALSVFVSLVMIIISSIILNGAKHEKSQLEAEIESMLSVEDIYAEHGIMLAKYQDVTSMYALTQNQNEQLNELITQLEEKLPSSMVVTALTVNNTGISMNITTNSKLSVAKMYLQLQEIDMLSVISIDSIAEAEDDNGITSVTFAVNCLYSNSAMAALKQAIQAEE